MTEKTRNMIEFLEKEDFESFKKSLFLCISEKLEEALSDKRDFVSQSVLEQGDAAAAAAEADAEKQALFVDPMMAKEFFLMDIDHKGHTITLKSLGTGIGKPVISYIDGEQFEVFTDKEIAKKESIEAVNRMIQKNIESVKNLRNNDKQLAKEKINKEQQVSSKPEKDEDKK